MSNYFGSPGVVVRQLCRPSERHLGTELTSNPRDLVIIGRDDHAFEQMTLQCASDRMGDHRLSAKRPDVLPRKALASPARRNDRHVHRTFLSALTTWSCSCSVNDA